MDQEMIKVLLVDDSPLALEVLSRILSSVPYIKVVGKAQTAREALNLIPLLKPHIVCTDYYMPVMDGLALTKAIMDSHPLPILVISGQLKPDDEQKVFALMEAGALDVIEKPFSPDPESPQGQRLIEKVRILSKVFVFRKHKGIAAKPPVTPALHLPPSASQQYKVVVIGASTGGPMALQKIFKQLPADFPVPILCVQHIDARFLNGFADWLKHHCSLQIKVVSHQEPLRPGCIYLPQEDHHLIIRGHEAISQTASAQAHRPSINMTMQSVAEQVKKDAIGVLLTGMGNDGAIGLLAMKKAGALTIAQNEASCVVFGMPKEAIALGAAQLVLGIEEIPLAIKKAVYHYKIEM